MRRLEYVLLAGLLLSAVWVASAWAAFPGHNGRIVFARYGGNSVPLYSAKPDGSGLRKITRAHYDSVPSIAPNGRTIAFARDAGQTGAIFTVGMSGGHPKRLKPGYEPAFSGPLGRRIAFTRFTSVTSQIWLMASDGTGERRLTDTPTADRAPAFSPDGEWIAFARRPENRPRYEKSLYKVRSDGSGLRRLTAARAVDSGPSFSPNGRSIVFDRVMSDGTFVIYLMRADGTHVHRLRRGAEPAFSPNGKRIAFVRRDAQICTMNRRGGHLHRVSPHSWTAANPDWARRAGSR